MKRITFASGTMITGGAVAAALLDFASQMSSTTNSATIDIPVLEHNGTISTHTIVLNSTIQFEVADVDGDSAMFDEDTLFPVPEMSATDDTMVAVVPKDNVDREAENFNRAVAEIDSALDHPES